MGHKILSILSLLSLCMLAVVLCVPVGASAQEPGATVRVTQVDTSAYPDITVYVAATDISGNPIAGLPQSEFAITEDGTPVDLTTFTGSGDVAMSTALLIDHSYSMEEDEKLGGAKDAARTFVNQMRPGDQTALIAFDATPDMLQSFTNTQDALYDTIKRLGFGDGTAIYDGVIQGVDVLQQREGRRVLLLLTDGQDCHDVASDSCPASYGSTHALDEAIAYANDYQQPVYVVGLGEKSRTNGDGFGIDETVLHRIASETGGDYFYAPDADQLVSLYNTLSANLHSEYALTYRSPRPFYDGTHRDIQVQVGELTSSGAYTERHLLNVQSNFLVGVVLLLPLVGLLLLPTLLSKRAPTEPATPATAAVPADTNDDDADDTPGSTSNISNTGQTQTTAPAHTLLCQQCGKPLRPGANFCGNCGTRQEPANRT